MANGYQKITRKEFAVRYRAADPDAYLYLTDDKLTTHLLKLYPEYSPYVESVKEEPISYEFHDPTLSEHLKKTWFNFKSMGMEIPQAVVGIAASALNEDSDLRDSMMDWSENMREWTSKKQDEWIETDPGIKGYLQWQQDKPFSLKNMWHADMFLRGFSDMAPSLATMAVGPGSVAAGMKIAGYSTSAILKTFGASGTALQANTFLSMAALEGSGEYNEAMDYLVNDPEGPQLPANEAVDSAASSAVIIGGINAMLEKYGIDRVLDATGLSSTGKRYFTKSIADKIVKNKTLNKGATITAASLVEAVTEATQGVTQEISANVREEYGGDIEEASRRFAEDLPSIIGNPNVKESALSALAGTLLTGGLLTAGGSVVRRLIRRKNDEEINEDIQEDLGHNVSPPPPDEVSTLADIPRDKTSVRMADVAGVTRYSEQDIVDEIRSEGPLGKKIDKSMSDIINIGTVAFSNAELDPDLFINNVKKERDSYGIKVDPNKLIAVENVAAKAKNLEAVKKVVSVAEDFSAGVAQGLYQATKKIEEKTGLPLEKLFTRYKKEEAVDTSKLDVTPVSEKKVKKKVVKDDFDIQRMSDNNTIEELREIVNIASADYKRTGNETYLKNAERANKAIDLKLSKGKKKEVVHPNILAERKRQQDEFIEKSKDKSLDELRGIAKVKEIPNANKLSKGQILEAMRKQEPSPLPSEVFVTKDTKKELQETKKAEPDTISSIDLSLLGIDPDAVGESTDQTNSELETDKDKVVENIKKKLCKGK